jgi:hypothetical protein
MDNKDLFMTPRVNQYGNHMVMTNVVKETKTKYLNIDTKFCDDIYSTIKDNIHLADYNFTLPERITDVKSIFVDNVEFPSNNLYNISQTIGNNCFQLIVGNTPPALITIPDGVYTDASLNQSINNSIFVHFNNSQDIFFYFDVPSQMTYIITTTLTGILYTFNFAVNKTNTFDKYNFKNKLGWLLGFRKQQYTISGTTTPAPNPFVIGGISVPYFTITNGIVAFSNSNTIAKLKNDGIFQLNPDVWVVSEMCYCFVVPKYYYLVMDEFSTNFQNAFSSALPFSLINKYIISKININNSSYFGRNSSSLQSQYISANSVNGLLVSGKRNYTGKIDIQKLNVKIVDDNGNLANLQGFDFSFCLKIEYE